MPVLIEFKKKIHYQVKPSIITLYPNMTENFILSFVPKAIGNFEDRLEIIVAHTFGTQYRLFGESHSFFERCYKKRGP